MKTPIIINSVLTAIVALTMNSLAQGADRNVVPRVHSGVAEVVGLRLNLAAGLIKALDSNLVCDVDAYPSSIIEHIQAAWSQASNQQKSTFLKKVPAKSVILKDLAFRIALEHVDFGRDANLEKFTRAIVGTQFYRFGSGVFGSRYNVTLGREGVAREQTMELREVEPTIRWHASKTTWSVELRKAEYGERFNLKIGGKIYEINRNHNGEVRLVPPGVKEDTAEYFEEVLTSSASYCEA